MRAGLIGSPVNITYVMLKNEYSPFGTRQTPDPPFDSAVLIQHALVTAFTIGVSPRVDRTIEHVADGGVGRFAPLNFGSVIVL
jgi:hypothetical protein